MSEKTTDSPSLSQSRETGAVEPARGTNQTPVEPWRVWSEDLRGGRYWCVEIPGVSEPLDIHEDDGGEALARRIANLPVMEAKRAGR